MITELDCDTPRGVRPVMAGRGGGPGGVTPSNARLSVTLSPTGTTLRSTVAVRDAARADTAAISQASKVASDLFGFPTQDSISCVKLMPVRRVCRKFLENSRRTAKLP